MAIPRRCCVRDGPFDFSWGGGRIFESARFFFGPHRLRPIIFYRILPRARYFFKFLLLLGILFVYHQQITSCSFLYIISNHSRILQKVSQSKISQ